MISETIEQVKKLADDADRVSHQLHNLNVDDGAGYFKRIAQTLRDFSTVVRNTAQPVPK